MLFAFHGRKGRSKDHEQNVTAAPHREPLYKKEMAVPGDAQIPYRTLQLRVLKAKEIKKEHSTRIS